MAIFQNSDLRDAVALAKALGDETRLRALCALRLGELCVCQRVELLRLAPATVSKHLSILRNAGIVEDDKRGVQVFYRLKVPCVLNFFGCVEAVLDNQAREAR